MPLSAAERDELIGPTKRMTGWNSATMPEVPNPPFSPPPAGVGWPVPGVRPSGSGFAPSIADDGPRIVSNFLSEGWASDEVKAGLYQLEDELKRAARQREKDLNVTVLPDDSNWTWGQIAAALDVAGHRAPGRLRSDKASVIHNLLPGTMLAALTAKGFRLQTPMVPLGLLSDDEFHAQLYLGVHLKDVLVGQDHGEWTHMLQWYLLAHASPLQTGTRAAEVFKYLGWQGMAQAKEWGVAGSTRQGPSLWRVCCDRDAPYHFDNGSLARNIDDLRNPDMLHVGLAGYAPNRDTGLASLLAAFPGSPILATFTQARVLWLAHRDKWPLLSALLYRRLMKRWPMWAQSIQLTHDLREEVKTRVTAALSTVPSVDIARSSIEGFFLKDFLDSKMKGPIMPNFVHLDVGPAALPSAEKILLTNEMRTIRNEYSRVFGTSNLAAIPYCWARLHRKSPVRVTAPPADATQILGAFRKLSPLVQAEVIADAGSEFRP